MLGARADILQGSVFYFMTNETPADLGIPDCVQVACDDNRIALLDFIRWHNPLKAVYASNDKVGKQVCLY